MPGRVYGERDCRACLHWQKGPLSGRMTLQTLLDRQDARDVEIPIRKGTDDILFQGHWVGRLHAEGGYCKEYAYALPCVTCGCQDFTAMSAHDKAAKLAAERSR